MDPNHRDRIAFLRLTSGRFTRGMKLKVQNTGRQLSVNSPMLFFASDRELAEEAFAGDVIGIPNHGVLRVGDSLSESGTLRFAGLPNFAPEILQRVRVKDPLKAKHLKKALEGLAEEGVTQLFRPIIGADFIVGAVGQLQFEVMADRLETEYGLDVAVRDRALRRGPLAGRRRGPTSRTSPRKHRTAMAEDIDERAGVPGQVRLGDRLRHRTLPKAGLRAGQGAGVGRAPPVWADRPLAKALTKSAALTSCKPFGSGFAVRPSKSRLACANPGRRWSRRPMFEFGRELRRLFGVARTAVSGQGWAHRRRRSAAGAARPAGCCAPRPRAPTSPPAASAPATAPAASWKPPWSGARWRAAPARPSALRKAAANAERAAEGYAAGHRQQGWARARLEQASLRAAGRRAVRRLRPGGGGRDRGRRGPARRRRGRHAGAVEPRPDPRPPQHRRRRRGRGQGRRAPLQRSDRHAGERRQARRAPEARRPARRG